MSYPGRVHLTVFCCKNLPKADLNGLADPYLIIRLGKTHCQTKTMKNTLNPIYNQSMSLNFDPAWKSRVLIVEVYDHDTFSSDDLLGSCRIDVEEFMNFKKRKTVSFSTKEGKYAGDLDIEILYDAPGAPKPTSSAPTSFAATGFGAPAPPYAAPAPPYSSAAPYQTSSAYPAPAPGYPSSSAYPPPPGYPMAPPVSYPPTPVAYGAAPPASSAPAAYGAAPPTSAGPAYPAPPAYPTPPSYPGYGY
ncbi:putative C2 domain [Monocercomonoides exilis]|uniref:putative C2 domain n=1 Tax=Monocercomonoides exilis TaxID=2049356 RepID=UPI003559A9CF|nr:putative C2 domain [Monocercomonoides exilis]